VDGSGRRTPHGSGGALPKCERGLLGDEICEGSDVVVTVLVLAQPVWVEVDGSEPSRLGTEHVVTNGVTNEGDVGDGHVQGGDGRSEDRRIGLGHTHGCGVDNGEHLGALTRTDLADAVSTELLLDGSIRVGHDAQADAEISHRPKGLYRVGDDLLPEHDRRLLGETHDGGERTGTIVLVAPSAARYPSK